MADNDRRERLPVEDIDTVDPHRVHITTSAVKDYRKTHPRSNAKEAREAIQDLLTEAVEAETLYETPAGYVRARVGRHVSVMLSSDLEVVVALHDDSAEKVEKRRKKVANNVEELRELLNPEKVHIGEAALTLFAEECELTLEEADREFRVALEEALEDGELREEPNRQRPGEKIFILEDGEFAYSAFPDGGMIFSCTLLD